MDCPRNGRYEERTSCREREPPYDQPRGEHCRRDDRSYDRQDDSIRPRDGDRQDLMVELLRILDVVDLVVILPHGGLVMRSL